MTTTCFYFRAIDKKTGKTLYTNMGWYSSYSAFQSAHKETNTVKFEQIDRQKFQSLRRQAEINAAK